MRVELLAYTPDADMLCAYAAHICYSSAPFDAERSAGILRKVRANGHLSVMEHASFSFLVEGLSRAASHQLVRHRLASYSQQSLRFTKAQPVFVSPPGHDFGRFYEQAYAEYLRLLSEGVHEEDARYVLPQGVASRLVVTMNARELRHFFELRCCLRAQFEIRALAWLMLAKAKAVAPLLLEDAGPICLQGMECPEQSFACHLKTKGQKGDSE
ncbi:MAG TPA: FAD-dependent thymidylate synthase [Clostridia bacterium]|nr:FAD-dependent thymidylate synthase [Clostridia bacterium]